MVMVIVMVMVGKIDGKTMTENKTLENPGINYFYLK